MRASICGHLNLHIGHICAGQPRQVLPDITADRWRYEGTARKRGHHADVWVLKLEPNEGYGTYHSNYTMYVTKVNTVLSVVDLFANLSSILGVADHHSPVVISGHRHCSRADHPCQP